MSRMVASPPCSTVDTGVMLPWMTIAVSMRVAGCRQLTVTLGRLELVGQAEGERGIPGWFGEAR
jgi:hypothetical protein